MIMGIVGLLGEKPKPTEDDIKSRMQRHLCRCCGYPNLAKRFIAPPPSNQRSR